MTAGTATDDSSYGRVVVVIVMIVRIIMVRIIIIIIFVFIFIFIMVTMVAEAATTTPIALMHKAHNDLRKCTRQDHRRQAQREVTHRDQRAVRHTERGSAQGTNEFCQALPNVHGGHCVVCANKNDFLVGTTTPRCPRTKMATGRPSVANAESRVSLEISIPGLSPRPASLTGIELEGGGGG